MLIKSICQGVIELQSLPRRKEGRKGKTFLSPILCPDVLEQSVSGESWGLEKG